MASLIAGWTAANVPGYRADMTLESDLAPDPDPNTGALLIVYNVVLFQQFVLADRGQAEILAGIMRSETEAGKKAEWQTWGPDLIRAGSPWEK